MTTALEILDSAVKIGLGALVSGIATVLVTSRNHAHELRKLTLEDRKSLLKSLAKLLEEANAGLNMATYGFEHNQENMADSAKMIIESINTLGEANSIAVLMGQKELQTQIARIRGGFEQLASHYLRMGENYSIDEANRLVGRINELWPLAYTQLEGAYTDLIKR